MMFRKPTITFLPYHPEWTEVARYVRASESDLLALTPNDIEPRDLVFYVYSFFVDWRSVEVLRVSDFTADPSSLDGKAILLHKLTPRDVPLIPTENYEQVDFESGEILLLYNFPNRMLN